MRVTKRKYQITLTTVTSLHFLTFTFWNSYVLKRLRLATLTFSDVTLSDINVVWCYVLSQYHPIVWYSVSYTVLAGTINFCLNILILPEKSGINVSNLYSKAHSYIIYLIGLCAYWIVFFLSVCKYRITYPRNVALLRNDPTLQGPPGAVCGALSLFILYPSSVQ